MQCLAAQAAGSMGATNRHPSKGPLMAELSAVLDRTTADLFDLDVRSIPLPTTPNAACSDTTTDGCSKECPSVGCTPTCSCK